MDRTKGILSDISTLSCGAVLDYLIWGNMSMIPFPPQAEEDAKGCGKTNGKVAKNVTSIRGKLSALYHNILE